MLVRDAVLNGFPSIQTYTNLAAVFEADCCFRTDSRLNPAADCCFKCEPLASCTMVLDDLDALIASEAQGVLREKLRSTYVRTQNLLLLLLRPPDPRPQTQNLLLLLRPPDPRPQPPDPKPEASEIKDPKPFLT